MGLVACMGFKYCKSIGRAMYKESKRIRINTVWKFFLLWQIKILLLMVQKKEDKAIMFKDLKIPTDI